MSTQNVQETIEDQTHEIKSAIHLPPYVAIKHAESGHYLAVVTEGDLAGHLEYNAAHDPQSPQAQFAVEKSFNPEAVPWDVHLRSLFNNKYCIRNGGSQIAYFTASALERGEEYHTQGCTVFRAFQKDSVKINLGYLGNGFRVRETGHQNATGLYWRLGWTYPNNGPTSYFDVVDVTKLVNLPKLVSFKGDNDKYLNSSKEQNGLVYNIFKGASLEDTSALYEIFPTSMKNYVRIKSYHFDMFLRRGHRDWVLSDSHDSSEADLGTLFELTQQGNAVVLRNVGNNKFSTRLTNDTMTDTLNTAAPDIPVPKEAHLEVVEPVVSRMIQVNPNNFRLQDARIYGHSNFDMDHGIAPNADNVPRVRPVYLKFTKSRSSTWNNTETIQWDGNATLRSGIPQIITESEVAIQGDQQGSYKWGQVVDDQVEIQVYREVLVPPRTAIRVTLVAKRATCEVPFSYVQTDQLTIGSHRTYTNADGLYKGTHVYAYDIKEVPEPLP